MRSRAGAAVLVALGLVMGACADDGEPTVAEDPKPVSGDAGGTTTTTAAIDVSTIPANIDEAYINAVLKALDQVEGDAARLIVERKKLVPEATDQLRAVYGEEEFQEQIEVWLRSLNKGLQNIKSPPGNRSRTLSKTISVSPDCVFVQVEEDLSETAVIASSPHTSFVKLVPLDPSRDMKKVNQTAWMIGAAGETASGANPRDLCAT